KGKVHGLEDRLLDLRPVEALALKGELIHIELAQAVGANLAQMHLKDLAPLALARQVDKEDLVEAALAQNLRRQRLNRVSRGGDEHRRLLLLHPRQDGRKDAGARAGVPHEARPQPGEALVQLVDEQHTGGHRLGNADHLARLGLALADKPAHQPPHVEAQQRKLPQAGRRLRRERLARALNANEQDALRVRQAVIARLRREGRRTLLQPQLEDVQPADVVHCLCRGPELQHFGAADALLLFLQHKRDGPLVEPPVARHGPRQPQPDAAHHQALARLHERIAPAVRQPHRHPLQHRVKLGVDLVVGGRIQVEHGDLFGEVWRHTEARREDDHCLARAAQMAGEVAHLAGDLHVVQKAVEVPHNEDRGHILPRLLDLLQRLEGVAPPDAPGKAVDEVPYVQFARGRAIIRHICDELLSALFFGRRHVNNGVARADEEVEFLFKYHPNNPVDCVRTCLHVMDYTTRDRSCTDWRNAVTLHRLLAAVTLALVLSACVAPPESIPPTATLAPSATPEVPTPTLSAPAEIAPTPEPPTPMPVTPVSAPGPCGHLLWPLVDGASWTYRLTTLEGEQPIELAASVGDVGATLTADGESRQMICGEGALAGLPPLPVAHPALGTGLT